MSFIFDTFTILLYICLCHIYMTSGGAMNKVREYREERKISQYALAKEIGVARQTINLIENDKYNPSLDLCLKLANALKTDLNSLFWEGNEND